jgi:hypothetical protein
VRWDVVAEEFAIPASRPAASSGFPSFAAPQHQTTKPCPSPPIPTPQQNKKRSSPEQDPVPDNYALVISTIGNKPPSSPSSSSSSSVDEHRDKRERLSDSGRGLCNLG